MPNPLDALRNAQSIGADPHPPPHPEDDWLGTAVQGLLGTMGLGDSNSHANLGGQLLGAAMPFAGALKARGSINDTLKTVWDNAATHDPLMHGWSEHPQYAAPLIEHLNEYKAEEPSIQGLLAQRATPRQGLPPQSIQAPQGFTFNGASEYHVPLSPNNERYLDWREKVPLTATPRPTPAPPSDAPLAVRSLEELPDVGRNALSAPATPYQRKPIAADQRDQTRVAHSQRSKLTIAGLSEDDVRNIRTIGSPWTAKKAYPNTPENTIISILRGDSFNWIK